MQGDQDVTRLSSKETGPGRRMLGLTSCKQTNLLPTLSGAAMKIVNSLQKGPFSSNTPWSKRLLLQSTGIRVCGRVKRKNTWRDGEGHGAVRTDERK